MDIVRAWTDEEYRLSLTEEQRALLPDNPAGLMELSDDALQSIVGGGKKGDGICGNTLCGNTLCEEHSLCVIGTSK
jgi:mersacidin/lichenicidin family type 2 lantibiotic